MKLYRLAAVVAVCASVTVVLAETPTTKPIATTTPAEATDADELMKPREQMAGYGVEQYRLVNEPGEIVSVLRSGATVIVKRTPSPAVAVRALVGTGGVYEGKWLGGGLSHLLEHLVAGGSCGRRTEEQNRNLLQQIGNNSNAYTTEDRTAFFVNTTPPHLDQAIDLVTGWITGAKITVPEYRREYEVVQRELEMGHGSPDSVFYEVAAMNRYHVSPARVPVIGYQDVIQGLSRDDVYSYYKLAYEPHNIVFCVVGDVDPEAALKVMERNLADFAPARVFPARDPGRAAGAGPPGRWWRRSPSSGRPGSNWDSRASTRTARTCTRWTCWPRCSGGGDGTQLTEDLRDDKDLGQQRHRQRMTRRRTRPGTFTVDLQLDADKVAPATAETLAGAGAGQDPTRSTRPGSSGPRRRCGCRTSAAVQTVEDVCSTLADDYMSTADVNFSDRYVERINRVTAEQIEAVARKYFSRSHLITTCLLPAEAVGAQGLPRAEDLLRGVAPTTAPTTAPAAGASRPCAASTSAAT